MKTKVLLLGAVVTAFAITSFATEPLLSPRAAGNAIEKVTAGSAGISVVDANAGRMVSPRAIGNEITIVAGSTGAAATCSKMAGSPKMIAECASHPGAAMACCKVADAK